MLGSAHASARITVVGGVTEILYLSIAKLSLGIHEQDFASDLVVLLKTMVDGQRITSRARMEVSGKPRSWVASPVDLTRGTVCRLARAVVHIG